MVSALPAASTARPRAGKPIPDKGFRRHMLAIELT